ncbi:IS5 family transposase [Labrys sp. KB_33_2]
MRCRHKKGTQAAEALGRSRGGFTTKLHASCDAKGRPLGFVLTPGEAHDVKGFGPLFGMIADKAKALLADRGYDSDAIREEIAFHGVRAVIPPKRGRRNPALHDRDKYRQRSRVEQLFNKLKNWRRIATRYDKTRESYLGFEVRLPASS